MHPDSIFNRKLGRATPTVKLAFKSGAFLLLIAGAVISAALTNANSSPEQYRRLEAEPEEVDLCAKESAGVFVIFAIVGGKFFRGKQGARLSCFPTARMSLLRVGEERTQTGSSKYLHRKDVFTDGGFLIRALCCALIPCRFAGQTIINRGGGIGHWQYEHRKAISLAQDDLV